MFVLSVPITWAHMETGSLWLSVHYETIVHRKMKVQQMLIHYADNVSSRSNFDLFHCIYQFDKFSWTNLEPKASELWYTVDLLWYGQCPLKCGACMCNAYRGTECIQSKQDDKMISCHDRTISSEMIRIWRRQVLTSGCTAVNDCNFVSMNEFCDNSFIIVCVYKRKHTLNGSPKSVRFMLTYLFVALTSS